MSSTLKSEKLWAVTGQWCFILRAMIFYFHSVEQSAISYQPPGKPTGCHRRELHTSWLGSWACKHLEFKSVKLRKLYFFFFSVGDFYPDRAKRTSGNLFVTNKWINNKTQKVFIVSFAVREHQSKKTSGRVRTEKDVKLYVLFISPFVLKGAQKW